MCPFAAEREGSQGADLLDKSLLSVEEKTLFCVIFTYWSAEKQIVWVSLCNSYFVDF